MAEPIHSLRKFGSRSGCGAGVGAGAGAGAKGCAATAMKNLLLLAERTLVAQLCRNWLFRRISVQLCMRQPQPLRQSTPGPLRFNGLCLGGAQAAPEFATPASPTPEACLLLRAHVKTGIQPDFVSIARCQNHGSSFGSNFISNVNVNLHLHSCQVLF